MYEDFFAERLAKLRMDKGISARDMSLSLGQSESYINKIENKLSTPSMAVFYNICEFLNVRPSEFFNEKINNPEMINKIAMEMFEFDDEWLEQIYGLVRKIKSDIK